MQEIIDHINAAIETCKASNLSVNLSTEDCLKNKNIFLTSVMADIEALKAKSKSDQSDEIIIKLCESVAGEILSCGVLCFNFDNNATVFLEENFVKDAYKVMEGLPISSSMQNIFENIYQSWHWHGH